MGPEVAAAQVAAWLGASVGNRAWLDALAEAQGWDLDADALPSLARYVAYDPGPIALEDYPAALVTVTDLVSAAALEVDEHGETYRSVYQLSILLLVRAEDDRTTDLLRKRLALAVRVALLQRKGLPGDAWAVVDPSSLAQSYSPTTADGDVLAAASTKVRISVDELLVPSLLLGVVRDVDVHADTLPVPAPDDLW